MARGKRNTLGRRKRMDRADWTEPEGDEPEKGGQVGAEKLQKSRAKSGSSVTAIGVGQFVGDTIEGNTTQGDILQGNTDGGYGSEGDESGGLELRLISGDPHRIRGEARHAAALIGLGVISEEEAKRILRHGLKLAERNAIAGKARAYASLMKIAITVARLELDRDRLEHEKKHGIGGGTHVNVAIGVDARASKILAICAAANDRGGEGRSLPPPDSSNGTEH